MVLMNRKYREVGIPLEDLAEILKEQYGLPPDTAIIDIEGHIAKGGVAVLNFWSDENPEIPLEKVVLDLSS